LDILHTFHFWLVWLYSLPCLLGSPLHTCRFTTTHHCLPLFALLHLLFLVPYTPFYMVWLHTPASPSHTCGPFICHTPHTHMVSFYCSVLHLLSSFSKIFLGSHRLQVQLQLRSVPWFLLIYYYHHTLVLLLGSSLVLTHTPVPYTTALHLLDTTPLQFFGSPTCHHFISSYTTTLDVPGFTTACHTSHTTLVPTHHCYTLVLDHHVFYTGLVVVSLDYITFHTCPTHMTTWVLPHTFAHFGSTAPPLHTHLLPHTPLVLPHGSYGLPVFCILHTQFLWLTPPPHYCLPFWTVHTLHTCGSVHTSTYILLHYLQDKFYLPSFVYTLGFSFTYTAIHIYTPHTHCPDLPPGSPLPLGSAPGFPWVLPCPMGHTTYHRPWFLPTRPTAHVFTSSWFHGLVHTPSFYTCLSSYTPFGFFWLPHHTTTYHFFYLHTWTWTWFCYHATACHWFWFGSHIFWFYERPLFTWFTHTFGSCSIFLYTQPFFTPFAHTHYHMDYSGLDTWTTQFFWDTCTTFHTHTTRYTAAHHTCRPLPHTHTTHIVPTIHGHSWFYF